MKLRKENNHERQTLTIAERCDLKFMRAEIVNLEAMLQEGVISVQEYGRQLEDISSRVTALEEKYDIR